MKNAKWIGIIVIILSVPIFLFLLQIWSDAYKSSHPLPTPIVPSMFYADGECGSSQSVVMKSKDGTEMFLCFLNSGDSYSSIVYMHMKDSALISSEDKKISELTMMNMIKSQGYKPEIFYGPSPQWFGEFLNRVGLPSTCVGVQIRPCNP